MGQQMYTLLVCLMIGLVPSLQSVNEHLYSFVRVGENYGTEYIPPPAKGAYFVFFQGEPVKVELEIFNEGSKRVIMMAGRMTPKDAFRMTVLEAPTSKVKAKLGVEVAPSLRLRLPNAETSVQWSERITLPPRSGLKFSARVVSEQETLPSGIYTLRFRCQLRSDTGGKVQAHSDTFSFEIRSVETFEDRLEVLRRQAARLFTRGEYQKAEQKLNELLLLYPNSSISYIEKGHLAMARGRKEEAATAYGKALDLLQSGMDTLYLSHASRIDVEHSIGLLMATLSALQKSR